MYELSRVRLFSVGPPGARYQDVCLDLRGVGAPVRVAPQADLFGADNLDRVPRRPAPASVLFLENGGGKSVLLKLVFSVLLPGRRQVVGTTNTRVLEKFVLGEDVGHVALEWMHTVTGERLVTGKVSEWRGHVVSTDPAKLIDAWYSFRPNEGFQLDDLPFSVDRRRVTLAGFRERLDAANQATPGLRLYWQNVHRDWSTRLVELGLDPELFRYQRAMNAGEGEAAEAFSFPTDEAFVDFLLRAVVDQEEPKGLAEVVAGYAAKIIQRGELELEREFVDGTLSRLAPLTEAEREAEVARARVSGASDTAHLLAASIQARHRMELDRVGLAAGTLTDSGEAERTAQAEERRLYDTATELRRRVAVLRHDAAQARHDELLEQNTSVAELASAWRAVEPVLRDQLASAEASRLRRVVAAEQDRAHPVLRARQEAAATLAAALGAVITDAGNAEREAGERAGQAAASAERARERELRSAGESAEHRAATDQARLGLHRIRTLVAEAVAVGLLTEGSDPAEAATEAEAAEQASAELVERSISEQGEVRTARREADARVSAARAAESAASADAQATRAALAEATERLGELAEHPRLAELLGLRVVQPERDLPTVLERLLAAIESAEEDRAELRAEQRRDLRAVRVLGEGGLLPVPEEIDQALALLESRGIVAHSGWRYLSRLPEQQRATVLHRVPHLVAGVLLADQADAQRARDELAKAQLLPCAIIAVGPTSAMREAAEPGPGVDFVVPPNPAMFDEDTADRVRVQLTEAIETRRAGTAALERQLESDRALAEQLRRWQRENPTGRIEELTEAAELAESRLRRASDELSRAEAEVAECDARSEAMEAELPALRATERDSKSRAARLGTLRDEAEREGELLELIRQAGVAAESAAARAARAREDAAAAHRDEQEQLRAQDRNAAVVATARDELAELPAEALAPDTPEPEARAGEPLPAAEPGAPLSVLRAEYRRAQHAYAASEVDADLRAALSAAERTSESARAAVHGLPDEVQDLAQRLLHGPDGSDAASRRAAAEQAERGVREVEARLREAHTELALARRARDEFRPQQRSLAPYGAPTDIEHGEQLLEQVARDHAVAEARVRAAAQQREATVEAQRRVERSADGFHRLVQSFDEPAPPAETDPAPFDADVDTAVARWAAVRAALRSATETAQAAEAEVRKAADEVALYAQDATFTSVHSPVRRHILGVPRAEMPGFAQDWLRALRPRLRSLDDDLANIGRHRSGIVTRLRGMVGDALRTLRLAQRLSQLPEGLSDWSGQQFLRIRFDEVDNEDELLERLGEVVDRTAEGYQSGGKEQRDGMSLLLRAVRAAMPRGVRVEMLKPDAVLRAERLRVSEIRDVFSGGQQLTAAIVLYCTMAALRANQRGEGGRQHAGVLFLDNPIGRASAGYLLELQFGVAEALGVQLIYTTGLFDAGALSAFPLIIRLRNDADLRAGRKYLSVDEQVASRLERLAPEDGTGQLSASRIFRRPNSAQQVGAADRG